MCENSAGGQANPLKNSTKSEQFSRFKNSNFINFPLKSRILAQNLSNLRKKSAKIVSKIYLQIDLFYKKFKLNFWINLSCFCAQS